METVQISRFKNTPKTRTVITAIGSFGAQEALIMNQYKDHLVGTSIAEIGLSAYIISYQCLTRCRSDLMYRLMLTDCHTLIMSQFQDLCTILSAAGVAADPEGKGSYLLFIDPKRPRLISKMWTGGKNFGAQEFITDSVRPNSTAPYLLTSTIQLIACVSSTDELRILKNEDEEWFDDEDIPNHKVHLEGKVAAAIGTDNRVCVFFQDPSKRLIVLERVAESWTPTALPADPAEGSPIATLTDGVKVHVFYISAKDNYIHYVVEETDGNWNDKVFASCELQENLEPKQIMVTKETGCPFFEVHMLTKQNALLKISQDEGTLNGKLTTYGKLDDEGDFEAEASEESGALLGFLLGYVLSRYKFSAKRRW